MAILSSPLQRVIQGCSCNFGNVTRHYCGAHKEDIFHHMALWGFFVVLSRSLATFPQ